MAKEETIIILDFGSQYTQLIARRIRELKVFCEIVPFCISGEDIRSLKPAGIILSGGPSNVYRQDAPLPYREIFELGIPILGICYGLQLIAHCLDGEVDRTARREYGQATLFIDDHSDLFKGFHASLDVWMSHGDHLVKMPTGFKKIGHTQNAPIAAIGYRSKKIYGVQFHPEVVHTPKGSELLKNFLVEICRCSCMWTPEHFVELTVEKIREEVKECKVVCGLSGGVDSAVTAVLIHKALGEQLVSVFVDNGVLRAGEVEEVRKLFKFLNLRFVDSSQDFLNDLKGIVDPEKKRKVIGQRFIQVFEAEAKKIGKVEFLAQGTLYPDVIESISTWGPSATIKSHHNVGGLPDRMQLKLIEPLRELFKDEVRAVGTFLGIDDQILRRHPFPGPGLAVRILGEVTEDRLQLLRKADFIFVGELMNSGWYDRVWQALSILLPVQTVGVMGDERTYEHVIALRAVTSQDGMTADWAKLPPDLMGKISNRIINEVRGINRVVYDISSKPPSTIEWE